MITRELKPVGHDWVTMTICVAEDGDAENLRMHIVERNTTLYDGKPWSTTFSIPLQYARIGQSLKMTIFTEHVMEYARLLEGA